MSDMVGFKNEFIEVKSFFGKSQWRKSLWVCRCKCGKEVIRTTDQIKRSCPKSCGCYVQVRRGNTSNHRSTTKHSLANKHPLYKTWKNIKQRCFNPNNQDYYCYGKKGITICNNWKNDFKLFFDWALKNGWKKGLSIDRIDSNKGYFPENCRFVTMHENSKKVFRDNPGLNKGSRHRCAILNEEQVREIKQMIDNGLRNYLIAQKYSVNPNIIYQIRHNKTWKHVIL